MFKVFSSWTFRFVVWVTVVAVAGCASTVLPFSQTVPAPADRVFYKLNPSSAAKVVVIRDATIGYRDTPRQILLNGEIVAELREREHVVFNVTPGDQVIGDRFNAPLNKTSRTTSFMAEPGKTYFFRVGSAVSGDPTFQRTWSADQ